MIRKVYTSKYQVYSAVISIDGKSKRIEFSKGFQLGIAKVKAKYSTTNKKIQDALESSKSFGVLYKLTSEEEVKETKKLAEQPIEDPKETLVVPEVTTMKEAIEYFTSEPYNLKVVQCNSKSKINARAKEHNIEFPNIVYDL